MRYVVLILICTVYVNLCAQTNPLQVSSKTFATQPVEGMLASHTRSGVQVDAVYGDIKTNVLMLQESDRILFLVTSALGIEQGKFRKLIVSLIQEKYNIDEEAIITSSSHNHCIPSLIFEGPEPEKGTPEYLSWQVGQSFIEDFKGTISDLSDDLKTVNVFFGKAEENRISYNRRGVYPTGETYFMREEDRILVGDGYRGLIDPDVSVVVFKDSEQNKPVAGLLMFACHPVVAYNPEKQFTHGQFPQIASEMMSENLGNSPVGFIQGTSGDINAKYMLTGSIEQANAAGEMLGQSALIALNNLMPSKRDGLEFTTLTAEIPFEKLPSKESLTKDLHEIDDFIRRGKAGDEHTLSCVGMNFPKALTPEYRANLITGVRGWYVWALRQHDEGKLKDLPTAMAMDVVVARFGDVGFVGLPYEAYVKTGLKIKESANLPMVLAAGYTNGSLGYIPDASATTDREYMSGYFRYRGDIPPYKAPGGDAAADRAIEVLNKFAK